MGGTHKSAVRLVYTTWYWVVWVNTFKVGQELYLLQHTVGRKPNRARKTTKLQPQYRQKAGIKAQKKLENGTQMDRSHSVST